MSRRVPPRPPLDTWPGGSYMCVRYVGWVNPLDMQPGDIDIRDIANNLARINRYTGATAEPYSVAEHSVKVEARFTKLAGGQYRVIAPRRRLAALLHDAPEAYINDMVNPVKRDPGMKRYVEIDDDLQNRIYETFDCVPDDETRALIKQADHEEFLVEWELPGGEFDHHAAERLFLSRYHWLVEEIEREDRRAERLIVALADHRKQEEAAAREGAPS
jgi:5'-deoxynucleotidase YfbR-like HD superfamily hydrolase